MSYVIFNDHLLYFELIMQVELEAQPTSLTLLDILFEYTPAFYNFLEKVFNASFCKLSIIKSKKMQQTTSIAKTLDEQFIVYMLEIDSRYKVMSKGDRAKIEIWVRHFYNQITYQSKLLCTSDNTSSVWKLNRNLYAMMLLD